MSGEIDIFAEDNEVAVRTFIPQEATVNQYASSVQVGNVVTLGPGESATVTNAGTAQNPVFNFGIPRGANGYGAVWGNVGGDIDDQTDLQAIIATLTTRIAALESSIPSTGTIIPSVLSTVPGFILCDGRAVSRTTYAALFSAIGVGFGGGDGVTTFNVPDYRNCFLRGFGSLNSNIFVKQNYQNSDHYHIFGYNSGNNNGTFAASNAGVGARMPNISQGAGHRGWNGSGGGGGYAGDVLDFGGNMITTIQLEAAGKNTAKATQEVRPTNYAVNFFIKY